MEVERKEREMTLINNCRSGKWANDIHHSASHFLPLSSTSWISFLPTFLSPCLPSFLHSYPTFLPSFLSYLPSFIPILPSFIPILPSSLLSPFFSSSLQYLLHHPFPFPILYIISTHHLSFIKVGVEQAKLAGKQGWEETKKAGRYVLPCLSVWLRVCVCVCVYTYVGCVCPCLCV